MLQKKSVVVSLIFMGMLLIGCQKNQEGTGQMQKSDAVNAKTSTLGNVVPQNNSPTIKPDIIVSPELKPTPKITSSTQSAETVSPSPANPSVSTKDGENLDLQKRSWYTLRNNQNKAPQMPAHLNKLLNKHNGIYLGDTSKKHLYLTFDEGYENGYTPKILDTLKEKNVQASFFVTGPYLTDQKSLIRRMIAEGHSVENHTVNHPSLASLSEAAIEKELTDLGKRFNQEFGKTMRYMRPPMGEYNERVLMVANRLGYKTTFWSFAYDDYDTKNQKGADYATQMILNNLHPGAILLLHAVSADNANVLGPVIDEIRARGYSIGKLE